ncbi:MAG: SIS domain-containing protein [Atopobium sp.]|jgi:DNA-binding MurR/RpiR family transcriptional regulator|nr:SIS domain-containing protein [Atopobium sp.]
MVQKLLDAEKLYFFATGDSQITLVSFRNKLMKLSIMAYDAMELGDEGAVCQNTREGDVALIVSYSGENERIAGCIPILKQHGSSILALTAMPESTCAEASDEVLEIPELEGDKGQKYTTFYSQFAFGYVLNLFYALIYSEMHKQS